MQEVSRDVKPQCPTIGLDRNVYALIGRVSNVLKAAGLDNLADEFVHKSMSVNTFEDLVVLSENYVDWK